MKFLCLSKKVQKIKGFGNSVNVRVIMRIKVIIYVLSALFVSSCANEFHSINIPYKKGKSIRQSYLKVGHLPKIGEYVTIRENAIFLLPTEDPYIECASVACDGIKYYIGIERDKVKYIFCMDEKVEINGKKVGDIVELGLITESNVTKWGDLHYLRLPIGDNWYALVNDYSNKIFMFVKK